MLKLLLVFFLSIVINVQTQSDWFQEMGGDDWEVSNRLAVAKPYYLCYQQAAAQMNTYGYAQHRGKIYRGQFSDPELNMPRYRAFGYQSDFNPKDFRSGAFNIRPQGQNYRAKAVHVNEGLANYVGEVRTMPIGKYVQEDGSILVQTSSYWGDPCLPNPCTEVRMSTCTAVNKFTAKCSRNEFYKLTLTWTDPTDDDVENDLNLLLVAAYHDGTLCAGITACGALYSDDDSTDYDNDPNLAEESATLTTLADGTKYQDYTYALIAYNKDLYNLSEGGPTLTVEYNGVVEQTLAIPQYVADGVNLNWASPDGPLRNYYFFGCFRPQIGFVDTRGAGFHDSDTFVINGLGIFAPGLCKETLSWTSGYGFNPFEQSGSGDEDYTAVPPCEPVRSDTDIPGNDIALHYAVESAASCQILCNQDSSCSFWTWVGPNYVLNPALEGRCFLKDGYSNAVFVTGLVSGTFPPCEPVRSDTDIPGNDIALHYAVESAASCQILCNQDSSCSFWTWVGPNYVLNPALEGRCFLKDGYSNAVFVTGLVSGTFC